MSDLRRLMSCLSSNSRQNSSITLFQHILSRSMWMRKCSTRSKNSARRSWAQTTKSSSTASSNSSCRKKSCWRTRNRLRNRAASGPFCRVDWLAGRRSWWQRFSRDENSQKLNATAERKPMFRAIKRLFIWLGLMAEQATETDAINQAVVERGIRDSKAKADKAHYANGQLAGQIALLRDQIKRQERQRDELQSLLQVAAANNDEANGAHYAEELATMEQDLADNKSQADNLEQLYKQNTSIIAESLREIQKFQREFEAVKAKVAIGRSLENLAGMMKSSITELQGMMGGEMGQSMQQLRQSAAAGEGQMQIGRAHV